MKFCVEHNKPFSEKSPNSKGMYWHVIDFDKKEYHSITTEEYNALEEAIRTVTGVEAGSYTPKDSHRIERQHSQDMAIQALQLMFKIDPDKLLAEVNVTGLAGVIRKFTDQFVKDLDN